MIGAIIGDIVGSRFEFQNHLSKEFEFLSPGCEFTDDTVMTCAVAQALMRATVTALETYCETVCARRLRTCSVRCVDLAEPSSFQK